MSPQSLSKDEKKILLEALKEEAKRRSILYRPYPKQVEFHKAGATFRERVLSAGNQQGKSEAGAAEMAMHLTGVYPDNWEGRRFNRPTDCWAGGITNLSTRDNPQKKLLGGVGENLGTGLIAKDSIISVSTSRGIADAIDTVRIKHVSGGESVLGFKSYEQGREKWQGPKKDVIWFDEEPPLDIYMEGLSRTNASGGMVYMTFTPLLGMSDVVIKFWKNPDNSPDRMMVRMTIHDALHISEEQREKIIRSYPEHERKARVEGLPILGSGRIFPIARETIAIDMPEIQKHWPRINGLDFGWDHPTAAVWLTWDRDTDTVYVYDTHRMSQTDVLTHAGIIRMKGDWIPVSWPHDGLQHDKGSGEQLAEQYRKHGVNMLPERATFEDGSHGVEAGVADMLDRMQTGRLKVAKHLEEWFEEFELYHRKDGKIVKERDDLMSATRYGIMMLRMAEVKRSLQRPAAQVSPWAL